MHEPRGNLETPIGLKRLHIHNGSSSRARGGKSTRERASLRASNVVTHRGEEEQWNELENSGTPSRSPYFIDDYGQTFENFFFFCDPRRFGKLFESSIRFFFLGILFAFRTMNNERVNWRIIYREIDKDKVSGNFS